MKLNVVYNNKISNYQSILDNLIFVLNNKNVQFKTFEIDAMDFFGDITIALGGDGTILKVTKFYAKSNIPVIGVNLGRLGFLSQLTSSNINNAVDLILNKQFFIEERLMLTNGKYNALNDFVIKGCDSSRTSKLYLEINNKSVCDYIADGIIVCTPTGSTAYGLSAGGPVVHPTIDAITIVPICPHTLNARPIVVPASSKITIKTNDKPLTVSIDGYETSESINEISITSSSTKARLAFINKDDFYNVIRNKLNWGKSPDYC